MPNASPPGLQPGGKMAHGTQKVVTFFFGDLLMLVNGGIYGEYMVEYMVNIC